MANKDLRFAAAFTCLGTTMVAAQDLAGIGFVDLSGSERVIGYATAAAEHSAAYDILFIDPSDGSVTILPPQTGPTVPDEMSGLVGFLVRSDFKALRLSDGLVQVDIDGDGEFVGLSACLTNEGIRLTVLSPDAQVLWSDTHYLGYDTTPTCAP